MTTTPRHATVIPRRARTETRRDESQSEKEGEKETRPRAETRGVVGKMACAACRQRANKSGERSVAVPAELARTAPGRRRPSALVATGCRPAEGWLASRSTTAAARCGRSGVAGGRQQNQKTKTRQSFPPCRRRAPARRWSTLTTPTPSVDTDASQSEVEE